jgi:hypothetical protein
MAALGETRLHSYSAAQLLSAIGRGYSFKPSHGIPFKNDGFISWTVEKIYYMLWGGRAKLLVKVGLGRVLTEACVLEVKGHTSYTTFCSISMVWLSPMNLSQVRRSPRIPPVF